MRPVNFKEATKTLRKPHTMTDAECSSLPVWCDGNQCVSCWRPSFSERVRILFGGNVWLGVLSGKSQPPVFVTSESVFAGTPVFSRVRAFLLDCVDFTAHARKTLAETARRDDNGKRFWFCFLVSLVVGLQTTALFGFLVAADCLAVKEWVASRKGGAADFTDLLFAVSGAIAAVPLVISGQLLISV